MEFGKAAQVSDAIMKFADQLAAIEQKMKQAHDEFHEVIGESDDLEEFAQLCGMCCVTYEAMSMMAGKNARVLKLMCVKERIHYKMNNCPESVTPAELKEFTDLVFDHGEKKNSLMMTEIPDPKDVDWDKMFRDHNK